MDAATRKQRVWRVQRAMERLWDEDSDCRPIAALGLGAVAAAVTAPGSDAGLCLLRDPAAMLHIAAGSLGLEESRASAMFYPNLSHADWQAAPEQPGYITHYAVAQMLQGYAAAGDIKWPRPPDAESFQPAIAAFCAQKGIAQLWTIAAAGRQKPGAEWNILADLGESQASPFDLERSLSEITGWNVQLLNTRQVAAADLPALLRKARNLYAGPA